MKVWLKWLFTDKRNYPACLFATIQIGLVIAGHTPLLISRYVATIFALWLIAGAFILLALETLKATKYWNGLGRSLTLLSLVTGLVFLPAAVNTTIQVAQGGYHSVYTNQVAQLIRDISYVAGVFAPVSFLGHLRYARKRQQI